MSACRGGPARWAGLAGALLLGLVCRAGAAEPSALEYDVKAAFLLNFVKFVQWPPASFREAGSPIALCLLRQNPFGDALDRVVDGESVGGRAVIVRRIQTSDDAPGCHVLFVPRAVQHEDGEAAVPEDPGVLTVGEAEGFLELGGVINFYTEGGRIRFAVNTDAAERSQLRLSARLMSVARLVRLERGSIR